MYTTIGIDYITRKHKGNTQDIATLNDQIEKTCKVFGISCVVFVGDKGMIKTKGQEAKYSQVVEDKFRRKGNQSVYKVSV